MERIDPRIARRGRRQGGVFPELQHACTRFRRRDTIGKQRDFLPILSGDFRMDVQLRASVCPHMQIIDARYGPCELGSSNYALKGHIKTRPCRRWGNLSADHRL